MSHEINCMKSESEAKWTDDHDIEASQKFSHRFIIDRKLSNSVYFMKISKQKISQTNCFCNNAEKRQIQKVIRHNFLNRFSKSNVNVHMCSN